MSNACPAEAPQGHPLGLAGKRDSEQNKPVLLLIRTMPPEPKVPHRNGLNINIDLTW
jgi:hypothetical protein